MDNIQILDKIKRNSLAIDELMNAAKAETRSLEPLEVERITNFKAENIALNLQLEQSKEAEKRALNDKFSLTRSLSRAMAGQQLEGADLKAFNEGNEEFKRFGQSALKDSVFIPSRYLRAITLGDNADALTTVGTAPMTTIANASILSQLGANIANYNSEYILPVYDGHSANWADETGAAGNGQGNIASVKLAPKRLTYYVDVALNAINMDNSGAEQNLYGDLISALYRKLESTIFGTGSGSTSQPQGIFYTAPTITGTTTYANVVSVEQALFEQNGVTSNNVQWVVSPSVKTKFRTVQKGTNSGNMIMEDNKTAIGYNLIPSNALPSGYAVLANFSELYVGTFGGLLITVDDKSQMTNGLIRLVVNAFFDAKFRSTAFYKTAKFS